MSIAELPIKIDRRKIAEFCRARGIRRLCLFASVLRADFDPERSDVDVLAEFEPGALRGVGFRHFGHGEELAAILGCKVDFCSRLNPYVEASVRREAVLIYERARPAGEVAAGARCRTARPGDLHGQDLGRGHVSAVPAAWAHADITLSG